MSKTKEFFNPPPEAHLWGTPVFRTFFCVPLFIALVLIAIVGFNEADRALPMSEWDGQAYTEFLKIYRLPLGVLASLIPLLALVAANHRSIQSAANLKAQLANNAFTNYYKHLEEFMKAAEKLHNDFHKHVDVRVLHRNLYPDAPSGDPRVAPRAFEPFQSLSEAVNAVHDHVFNGYVPEYEAVSSGDSKKLDNVWAGKSWLLVELLESLKGVSEFAGQNTDAFFVQQLKTAVLEGARKCDFIAAILVSDASQEAIDLAANIRATRERLLQAHGHERMKILHDASCSAIVQS